MPATPQWRPGEEWRVGSAPRLVLGSEAAEPAYQFWWIAAATSLSDGRLAVLDSRVGNVRLFSPQGTHLTTIGRAGRGPGEFQSPVDLVRLAGDTLVVLDRQQGFSISRFTAAGELLDRSAMPPAFLERGQMSALGILLADGSLLYNATTIEYQREFAPGLTREPVGLFRRDPAARGQVVDTVGWFEGTEMFGAGDMGAVNPFAAELFYLRGPDGLYLAHSETGEVLRFDYRGRLQQRLQPALPRRTLSRADYNRYREDLLSRVESAEKPKFERFLAAVPRKANAPALSGLHVDRAGNLWLQHYRPRWEPQTRWTVVDAAGRTLGEVAGPEYFTPLEIGDDYLLGRRRDELDLQQLVLYDLAKAGAAEPLST